MLITAVWDYFSVKTQSKALICVGLDVIIKFKKDKMYKVVTNNQITATTNLLTIKPDDSGQSISFTSGQYAAISFYSESGRPTVARCFSIVSSPLDTEKLQFSMRTSGRYTKAIKNLRPGDNVKVMGPFGGFVFDSAEDQDALFLAGGIGITPFISIIRYLTQIKSPNKITLVYSCRQQDDIPFLNELIELEKQNPNFKVAFVISEGSTDTLTGQRVAKGRITPELIDNVVRDGYDTKTFYICGPSAFMGGMTKILHSRGVKSFQIVTEAFSQGSLKQTGKIKSWPFNIYVLGAVGIALGSFIVTIFDVLKTLPPSNSTSSSSVTVVPSPISTRQSDLDQLVNQLSANASTGVPTDQAKSAQNTPLPTTQQPPATPVPKVICRTSASGVRTCF